MGDLEEERGKAATSGEHFNIKGLLYYLHLISLDLYFPAVKDGKCINPGKLVQLINKQKVLVCNACQFLWGKYSHHGRFSLMNGLTVAQKIPGYLTIALPSLYQPGPAEHNRGTHKLNIYDTLGMMPAPQKALRISAIIRIITLINFVIFFTLILLIDRFFSLFQDSQLLRDRTFFQCFR